MKDFQKRLRKADKKFQNTKAFIRAQRDNYKHSAEQRGEFITRQQEEISLLKAQVNHLKHVNAVQEVEATNYQRERNAKHKLAEEWKHISETYERKYRIGFEFQDKICSLLDLENFEEIIPAVVCLARHKQTETELRQLLSQAEQTIGDLRRELGGEPQRLPLFCTMNERGLCQRSLPCIGICRPDLYAKETLIPVGCPLSESGCCILKDPCMGRCKLERDVVTSEEFDDNQKVIKKTVSVGDLKIEKIFAVGEEEIDGKDC